MITTIERLRARREELGQEEGGFTLIELLIVIVILGILAAIVVFAVQNLSGTTSAASCQTDLSSVDHAVQAYAAENSGAFPTSVNQLVTSGILHQQPVNGAHYAIEMDKFVSGTGPYTQAANTGGTAGQIDVLTGGNANPATSWAASTAYNPASANGINTACASAK